jgi:hypothetical protein
VLGASLIGDPAHRKILASDAWVGIGVVDVGVENGAAVDVEACADAFSDTAESKMIIAKLRCVKILFICCYLKVFIVV